MSDNHNSAESDYDFGGFEIIEIDFNSGDFPSSDVFAFLHYY